MALRVWLPLNGNLENKGISNFGITSIGTVAYDNNGKIGKSFISGGTSQTTNGINIDSNLLNILGTQCSIAIWVKPLGNHVHYNGTFISSGDWNKQRWAFGVSQDNSKVDVLCGSYNNYISCPVPVNVWTHLVSIFDNGVCTLYKNGEYIGQLTGQAAFVSDASNTCIGRETYAGGYFGFNGRINDVRIYDHCLSAKEVKEISQGLVLHYKLDSTMIESTTNLCTVAMSCPNPTNISIGEYTGSLGICQCGNKKITYSAYIKNTSNVDVRIRCSPILVAGGYSTYRGNVIASGESGWSSVTVDLTDSSTYTGSFRAYFQNGASGSIPSSPIIIVQYVQVEEKDHRTEWTLGGTTRTGYVKDSSGYENDGTLWSYDSAGSIDISTDTSRYNLSTYINSSDNTTNTASGTKYIYGNCTLTTPQQLTVAFWEKPIAGYGGGTSQGQFSLTNNDIGSNAASDYQGAAFNHRDGGIDINSSDNNHLRLSIDFTVNQWHHYVFTYDGITARSFKDGVQQVSTAFSATKTLGSFKGAVIGFSKAGGVWRSNKSYYSDFRIYATALSAEDVLELYHTPASIDNLGNAHAFEFVEDDSTIKVEKNGVFKNKWSEGLELKTLSDGSIWAKIFYFNYDESGAVWTPEEAKWCSKKGKYSCLGDLEKFIPKSGWYEFWYTEQASGSKFIRWKQSYNPLSRVTSDASGTSAEYQFIDGTSVSSFTGLTRFKQDDDQSCYLRGYPSWWGAIAPYQTSYDVFPSMWGGSTGNHHQELWINITENQNISKLNSNGQSISLIEK